MNPLPANDEPLLSHQLTPAVAWTLWKTLNQLSESLWDAYEQEFLEFCIQESDSYRLNQPLPFEDQPSALTHEP